MASLHNPHPPGSAESEAYHGHLVHMAQPANMHRYLGREVADLIGEATTASAAAKTQQLISSSHDERAYDQPDKTPYANGKSY